MSIVTSVYIQFCCCEDELTIIKLIDDYLETNAEPSHRLKQMQGDTGGSKSPQTIMLGGGFNYFPETYVLELAKFLEKIPWEYPLRAVMITYREGDEGVKVWRFND